ncbi:unnamed protein product [Boreogadus saida]
MKQTERYGALDGTTFISKRLSGLIGREEMKEVFYHLMCITPHPPQTFTGDGPVEPARPLRPQCNPLPIVMIAKVASDQQLCRGLGTSLQLGVDEKTPREESQAQ